MQFPGFKKDALGNFTKGCQIPGEDEFPVTPGPKCFYTGHTVTSPCGTCVKGQSARFTPPLILPWSGH